MWVFFCIFPVSFSVTISGLWLIRKSVSSASLWFKRLLLWCVIFSHGYLEDLDVNGDFHVYHCGPFCYFLIELVVRVYVCYTRGTYENRLYFWTLNLIFSSNRAEFHSEWNFSPLFRQKCLKKQIIVQLSILRCMYVLFI